MCLWIPAYAGMTGEAELIIALKNTLTYKIISYHHLPDAKLFLNMAQ